MYNERRTRRFKTPHAEMGNAARGVYFLPAGHYPSRFMSQDCILKEKSTIARNFSTFFIAL